MLLALFCLESWFLLLLLFVFCCWCCFTSESRFSVSCFCFVLFLAKASRLSVLIVRVLLLEHSHDVVWISSVYFVKLVLDVPRPFQTPSFRKGERSYTPSDAGIMRSYVLLFGNHYGCKFALRLIF